MLSENSQFVLTVKRGIRWSPARRPQVEMRSRLAGSTPARARRALVREPKARATCDSGVERADRRCAADQREDIEDVVPWVDDPAVGPHLAVGGRGVGDAERGEGHRTFLLAAEAAFRHIQIE